MGRDGGKVREGKKRMEWKGGMQRGGEKINDKGKDTKDRGSE